MCGRFSLTKEEIEIEKRFNAKFYSNDLVKRYNVAPSQLALVLTDEKPQELQLYKWGLIPVRQHYEPASVDLSRPDSMCPWDASALYSLDKTNETAYLRLTGEQNEQHLVVNLIEKNVQLLGG